jgi:hypothetical protein
MANVIGKNPIVIDTPNNTTPQITRSIYPRSIYIQVGTAVKYNGFLHDQNGTLVWTGNMASPDGGATYQVQVLGPFRMDGIWVKGVTATGGGLLDRVYMTQVTTKTRLFIYER